MDFGRYYYVSDRAIGVVPQSHGLDAITRLCIRLSSLPEINYIKEPRRDQYVIDASESDFLWYYRVEKSPKFTWEQVSAAIAAATNKFLKTFTPAPAV